MTLDIKAQRWLAVSYRCPKCGNTTYHTMLKRTKRNRERVFECQNWSCRSLYEIVERRYWTSFCIEVSLSQTTIAGTLPEFGGWRVCHIVHRNIREFKQWYRRRKREQAEEARAYQEKWQKIYAEADAKRQREREQERLLKEASLIAYRREHAAELIAEQVAASVWIEPPTIVASNSSDDFLNDDGLDDLDDCPF